MRADTRPARLAAWGLALVLLALGAAGGVAADRLLASRTRPGGRGPPSPSELLERLRGDLELSDAQARAILPVLEERSAALASLFARMDPEAEVIRKRADERIRALLEPDQRARFEARVAEQERRRAELRRRVKGTPDR